MTAEEEAELEKRLHADYGYIFESYKVYGEWERYIKDNNGKCPALLCWNGIQYAWDVYGYNVSESTCGLCNGSGRASLSDVQKYREETDKEICKYRERLVELRRHTKISLLQHENKNLLLPTKWAQVYVKVTPK